MSLPIDYSRYQTLNITRRGANQTVLDIQMKAPLKTREQRRSWLEMAEKNAAIQQQGPLACIEMTNTGPLMRPCCFVSLMF